MFMTLAAITPEIDSRRMVKLARQLGFSLDRYSAGEDLDLAERLAIELNSAEADEVLQMAIKVFEAASTRCGGSANDTTLEEGVENAWKSCLQYVERTLKVRLT